MAKSEAVRLMEENGAVGKIRSWPARIKSFYIDVELITPIAAEEGLRFAIREGGRTVGAGVVTKIVE